MKKRFLRPAGALYDQASWVTLRRDQQFGGETLIVDGLELPNVISYRIQNGSFPRISVEILVDEVSWEESISPKGLDDVQSDRTKSDKAKGDVHSGFPRNGLPAKIKALFRQGKAGG